MAVKGIRPMQNSKIANILDFLEPNPDSFSYRSVNSALIRHKDGHEFGHEGMSENLGHACPLLSGSNDKNSFFIETIWS